MASKQDWFVYTMDDGTKCSIRIDAKYGYLPALGFGPPDPMMPRAPKGFRARRIKVVDEKRHRSKVIPVGSRSADGAIAVSGSIQLPGRGGTTTEWKFRLGTREKQRVTREPNGQVRQKVHGTYEAEMREGSSVPDLPTDPAVYALCGGHGQGLYVAYVGIADSLRRRITQHLVDRRGGIEAPASAVSLNPHYVTEVRWWEHPEFRVRAKLEAAELAAFDVLDPALRSRAAIPEQVRKLYDDESFKKAMHALFVGRPAGRLVIPTLQDAIHRIADLEKRMLELEERLIRQQSTL